LPQPGFAFSRTGLRVDLSSVPQVIAVNARRLSRRFSRPFTPALLRLVGVAGLTASLVACGTSNQESLAASKRALGDNDLAAAIIHLRNAARDAPQSLDVRLTWAEVLERQGDMPGAEEQLRRALEFGGNPNLIVPRLAALTLDQNSPARLLKETSPLPTHEASADAQIHALRAMALMALGRMAEAADTLAQADRRQVPVEVVALTLDSSRRGLSETMKSLDALDLASSPWWVQRAAARLYFNGGKLDRAAELLTQARGSLPGHPGLAGELAEAQIARGRIDEARTLRAELIKRAPLHYRTGWVDALLLLHDQQPAKAYDRILQVLAALPEHHGAIIAAAKLEIERGDFDTARARLDKVLGANPGSIEALRIRAEVALRDRQIDLASTLLRKASSLSPDSRQVSAALADLEWARGNRQAAITMLTRAARTPTPDALLLARLAGRQLQAGRKIDAQATIEEGMRAAAQTPAALGPLARAALAAGLNETVLQIAERGLSRSPESPEPLMWKAGALGATGQGAEARQTVLQALDRKPDYMPALLALRGSSRTPDDQAIYAKRISLAARLPSRDGRLHAEHVRLLREAGAERETVSAALKLGIQAAPQSVELRRLAVTDAFDRGDRRAALELAQQTEAVLGKDPEVIKLVGSVYERLGDYQQASQRFAPLASAPGASLDIQVRYARIQAKLGRQDAAVFTLRTALKSFPKDPAAYAALALQEQEAGKTADALATARSLAGLPGQRIAGGLLLGDVHAKAGQRDDALKAWDEVARQGGIDPALQRKVTYLMSQADPKAAQQDLTRWLQLRPGSTAARMQAAAMASQASQYSEAVTHLQVVLAAEPGNVGAAGELAWSWVKLKDRRAVDAARAALKLAPGHPRLLDTLGHALSQAGDTTGAIEAFKQALSSDREIGGSSLGLAKVLIDTGDTESGRKILRGIDPATLDREQRQQLERMKAG
jgi:putative PEP-CTERM system TPR-repeat lipoprotein